MLKNVLPPFYGSVYMVNTISTLKGQLSMNSSMKCTITKMNGWSWSWNVYIVCTLS